MKYLEDIYPMWYICAINLSHKAKMIMETKDLNLGAIQEVLHDFTFSENKYHVGELSTVFRKIAIELASYTFHQLIHDGAVNLSIEDYIYKLQRFADALDTVDKAS